MCIMVIKRMALQEFGKAWQDGSSLEEGTMDLVNLGKTKTRKGCCCYVIWWPMGKQSSCHSRVRWSGMSESSRHAKGL